MLQSWSFWKVPEVLLEITRGGKRERERNLSFDSLLIWDNFNPALMQIQGCGTTHSGPAPQPKQICGELKARMADSEPYANSSSCDRLSRECEGRVYVTANLGLFFFFFLMLHCRSWGKMEAGRTWHYFIHAVPPADRLIFRDTMKHFHEIIKRSGSSLASTLACLKCLNVPS